MDPPRVANRKRVTGVIRITALLVMGGGLVSLASLIHPLWSRYRLFQELFPLEFLHLARFFTLVIGFALVFTSINLFKRKRRAFRAALVLGCFGVVLHLIRGRDLVQVGYSVLVVLVLLQHRHHFTVKSGPPQLRSAIGRIVLAAVVGLAFGVFGFWLLDRRDFGIDFTLRDAIVRSLEVMLLFQDPGIVPRTDHARRFLDSLEVMSWTMLAYSASVMFRPVVYQMFSRPHDRRVGARIVEAHGRSSLDYFKSWPDKSIFLSASAGCFLAYRVGRGFAIVLGDPVGPDHEVQPLVEQFAEFCGENDWGIAFHQTTPDFLERYRGLGLRKLKEGDEAIVELPRFSLEGRAMKRLRNTLHKLEGQGMTTVRHDPPHADSVIRQAREVSDDWLTLPGRRERRFTLGWFDLDYVRSTPLVFAMDAGGRLQAFVNVVPSYVRGEATIDLMRHRIGAPGGTMDLLLIRLLEGCRALGFERFSLGMAPLAGFQEGEEPSIEERAVHFFLTRLHTEFSYHGMRQFKAKFATRWEPRYLVYRHIVDLPTIAAALREVSEFPRSKDA